MENRPGKTMKVGGEVETVVDGNLLIIEANGGLVTVSTFDTAGIVLWMWHPLSGWYIERDLRKGQEDGEGGDLRTDSDPEPGGGPYCVDGED